jgi:hypothetical protein
MSAIPGGSAVAPGLISAWRFTCATSSHTPGTAPDFPSARLECEPARELPVEPREAQHRCRAGGDADLSVAVTRGPWGPSFPGPQPGPGWR